MRGTLLVLGTTLVLAVGCGLLSDPPPVLHNVRSGACGGIEGEVSGNGELVVITVDGTPKRQVSAPRDGTRASFDVVAGPGTYVVSHEATDVEHTVTVNPPPASASWAGLPREVRQGQRIDPLPIHLQTSCGDTDFTLTARIDDQLAGQGSGPVLAVDPNPLNLEAGSHTLTVKVASDGAVVSEDAFSFEIGPPCTEKACKDADGDGFVATAFGGDDCDDDNAFVHPGATRFPDPDGDGAIAVKSLDLDCDGEREQVDMGVRFDCDETDPRIPRDEDPTPTGVDEDCDGLVDEGTSAFDDDGDGVSEDEGDCRDDDRRVAPGRSERPDCKDNDCDGEVDEGVTRPERDDRYEPNDSRPWALPGAKKKRGFFGGYTATRDSLNLVLRDADDVETFTLFAHDGTLDSFHVTVTAESIPDDATIGVRVTGPNGGSGRFSPRNGVRSAAGGLEPLKLVTLGKGLSSDTGTYTIRFSVIGDLPAYCPVEVTISSG